MKCSGFVFLATFLLVQWSGVDSAAKGNPPLEQQTMQEKLPPKAGCGCPCGKRCQCGLKLLTSLHNVTADGILHSTTCGDINLRDPNIKFVMVDPKTNVTTINYGCKGVTYLYPEPGKKSFKTKLIDGICKVGLFLLKPDWSSALMA